MTKVAKWKSIKSEKDGYGLCGKRVRAVRESLGLSRPKFAMLLGEGFPETTLKNYELGYRDLGIEVINQMGKEPKLRPYVNFVLFGVSDMGEQLVPSTDTEPYDKYAFARGKEA